MLTQLARDAAPRTPKSWSCAIRSRYYGDRYTAKLEPPTGSC
jgi:hypothetical protein